MTTIITESGRTKELPAQLDVTEVAGLDQAGRIVVDYFGARNDREGAFMFGLTLCCNASDKGGEHEVYCRACYGTKPNADVGNYLYRESDGSFPGLDPVKEVRP